MFPKQSIREANLHVVGHPRFREWAADSSASVRASKKKQMNKAHREKWTGCGTLHLNTKTFSPVRNIKFFQM
jgi:hypothetical protein